jgi:hypothetical protein
MMEETWRTMTSLNIVRLAKAWADSKAHSTFANMEELFTWEAFATYLTEQITNPNVHIAVIGTKPILAACGVRLVQTEIPPHIPIACEWMWFGQKRQAAQAMIQCRAWALQQGARYLVYATHNKQHSTTRFTEHLNWRKLC